MWLTCILSYFCIFTCNAVFTIFIDCGNATFAQVQNQSTSFTTAKGQFIFCDMILSTAFTKWVTIELYYDGSSMLQMEIHIKTQQQMLIISVHLCGLMSLFAWERVRLHKWNCDILEY